MKNSLFRSLSFVGLLVFCLSIQAEEKAETENKTAPAFKPYVSVSYLSEIENKMLEKTTRTRGSSVYIWMAGANGPEGDFFGLGYLEVAIRRYSEADLFFVEWDDVQFFDRPLIVNRWTYNRKRSLLFWQAKEEAQEWPQPRFVIFRKVTDEVIRQTASSRTGKNDTTTLYDVTKHGAER